MRCLRFFLLAVFTCFIGDVQAQSGCVVGGMYIYNVPDGTFGGVPAFRVENPATSYGVLTSLYCVAYGAPSTCYVNSSSYMPSYGTLVSYSALPCPLDDYILPITGIIGLLAFYRIRDISDLI